MNSMRFPSTGMTNTFPNDAFSCMSCQKMFECTAIKKYNNSKRMDESLQLANRLAGMNVGDRVGSEHVERWIKIINVNTSKNY